MLRLHQQRCKYAFVDRFKGLKGAAVNLTLAWNIMPHVGECVCPGLGAFFGNWHPAKQSCSCSWWQQLCPRAH